MPGAAQAAPFFQGLFAGGGSRGCSRTDLLSVVLTPLEFSRNLFVADFLRAIAADMSEFVGNGMAVHTAEFFEDCAVDYRDTRLQGGKSAVGPRMVCLGEARFPGHRGTSNCNRPSRGECQGCKLGIQGGDLRHAIL